MNPNTAAPVFALQRGNGRARARFQTTGRTEPKQSRENNPMHSRTARTGLRAVTAGRHLMHRAK